MADEKYKIFKIDEFEYGKVIITHYAVREFKRSWMWIIIGLVIPILGWIFFFLEKPYKKDWITVETFDKLDDAKYWIKNDETYDYKETEVDGGP